MDSCGRIHNIYTHIHKLVKMLKVKGLSSICMVDMDQVKIIERLLMDSGGETSAASYVSKHRGVFIQFQED